MSGANWHISTTRIDDAASWHAARPPVLDLNIERSRTEYLDSGVRTTVGEGLA